MDCYSGKIVGVLDSTMKVLQHLPNGSTVLRGSLTTPARLRFAAVSCPDYSWRTSRPVLHQSNISEKNLARLSKLAASEEPEIAGLATLVLEVGKVKPHKRRRVSFLARNHRSLLAKLEERGLIWPFN